MKELNAQEFVVLLHQAQANDVESMIKVARAYEGGFGTQKNTQTALWWFLRSAQAGHPQAQYEVALWYSDGVHCVTDYQKSVYWCKRAAMQGLEEAVDYLDFLQGFDI